MVRQSWLAKNRGALLVIAPLVVALALVWIIYGDPFHIFSSDPQHTGERLRERTGLALGDRRRHTRLGNGVWDIPGAQATHPESNMTQTATSSFTEARRAIGSGRG